MVYNRSRLRLLRYLCLRILQQISRQWTQPSYLPTTASTTTTQPAAVKSHPHPKSTVEHPPVKKEKPEAINILGMSILSNTANKSTHYSRPQAAKNCDLLLFDLAQDLSNDGILHLMSTLNTPTSQAHPFVKTMPEKALHHNVHASTDHLSTGTHHHHHHTVKTQPHHIVKTVGTKLVPVTSGGYGYSHIHTHTMSHHPTAASLHTIPSHHTTTKLPIQTADGAYGVSVHATPILP